MKTESQHMKQENDEFSYEALLKRGTTQETKDIAYTKKEMAALNYMSPALKACLDLRNSIENHQFGYFFKYPVNSNNPRLSDYEQKIRKPIDLKTIRHKFFNGIYRNIGQFDKDMKQMFENALTYNHHQDNIITNIASLLELYLDLFKKIEEKVLSGELSDKFVFAPRPKDPFLNGFSESQLNDIFNDERRKKLGKILEFLQSENRNKIKNMLMKRFPQLSLRTVKNKSALFLSEMSHQQIWELLKESKNMKQSDFDMSQISRIEKESPDMVGYNQLHFKANNEERESSFQVEDESDSV